MACLRLVTLPPFPPLPERRVPLFFRRMALSTLLLAASPYLRVPLFLEPERFCAAIFFLLIKLRRKAYANGGLRREAGPSGASGWVCTAFRHVRYEFRRPISDANAGTTLIS